MILLKIKCQLAKNTTYIIAKNINFNLNIAFQIKIIKNKGFSKDLSQPNKS